VSVPSYATEVQKRAVRSIFYKSGAREVVLIEGVVLAASGLIGEKMMTGKTGMILMDIGGGKTEVAVISLGGVVVERSSKVAGNELDATIINYMKLKYGLLIGQNSAERVKIEIGNVGETKGEGRSALLRGRDLETGLPRSIKINEGEIREAIIFETQKIAKLVKGMLDETPPELMEDILKRGIVLVGGGASLRGMDKLIEKETKINTKIAEESIYCVVRGIEELLENPKLLQMIKVVGGMRK
jgi:rod shape-determining protein MreB